MDRWKCRSRSSPSILQRSTSLGGGIGRSCSFELATMEERECKSCWAVLSFLEKKQSLNRGPRKTSRYVQFSCPAVVPLGQRYYRCWSPCGTQCTARPSCGGSSQRYRSCQAWRYYRGAAGSTAGILRIKQKESSGSTRRLPLGTVASPESKFGLAVPLAVPPAVVPLAEASGTTRYHRQEKYQLCCRSPAPGGAVLPLRQRYYRQTQKSSTAKPEMQ